MAGGRWITVLNVSSLWVVKREHCSQFQQDNPLFQMKCTHIIDFSSHVSFGWGYVWWSHNIKNFVLKKHHICKQVHRVRIVTLTSHRWAAAVECRWIEKKGGDHFPCNITLRQQVLISTDLDTNAQTHFFRDHSCRFGPSFYWTISPQSASCKFYLVTNYWSVITYDWRIYYIRHIVQNRRKYRGADCLNSYLVTI